MIRYHMLRTVFNQWQIRRLQADNEMIRVVATTPEKILNRKFLKPRDYTFSIDFSSNFSPGS